jgi:hypothetical protein
MARVVEQLLVSTRPWVQPQYHQQPRKKKNEFKKEKHMFHTNQNFSLNLI